MTQRLPVPGQDDGSWGDILNGFLEVAHNADGTLIASAVSAALPSPIPTTNLGNGTASSSNFLRGDGTWAVPSGTAAGNATTSAPGLVQLAGDLAGTATAPTLATTANVASIISANTTVAGAVQKANNLSDLASASTARTNLGLGSAATISSTAGGDLSGTLPSPTVAKINGVTLPSSAPTSGNVLTATSATATSWTTPAAGVTLDNTTGDIQALGAQAAGATGKAADAGHVHAMPRLDQVNAPIAAVALNSQKITGLANGTAATDAAAFGQIPVAGTTGSTYTVGNDSRITSALQPTTVTTGDLSGTYAATTVAKINGTAVPATPSAGQVLTATSSTAASWATPASTGAQALSPTAVKTSAYTASPGDLIPVDATSAAITITLPTAPADKTRVLVKKIDSTTNIVTITAGGSDVFNKTNGSTGLTLTLQNQSINLQYASGTSIWYAVGSDTPLSQLDARYPLSTAMPGGDLVGTYAVPTVAKVNGVAVAGTPASGQVLTATSSTAASWATIAAGGVTGAHIFNVKDYGAKGDGIRVSDVSATSGASTVTSSSYTFTVADVGKLCAVEGAGVTTDVINTVWQGIIQSVSSGVATLSTNASTTVSNARATFGTNDDAAFAAAHNAAKATISFNKTGAGDVYLPSGRYIVVAPINRASYVSFRGEGRLNSIVAPITASGNWMNSNGTALAPIIGVNDADFGIEGGCMNCGGSYQSQTKPYNLHDMKLSSCMRMSFTDTPATSIPFDNSQDQVTIAFNYVYNPGRCAGTAGGNPGGSGIGVGMAGTTDAEPVLVFGNTIIGLGTSSVLPNGNYGIFLEAQNGTAATASTGVRIVNNYVRGMRSGINDAGARGSIIEGNIVESCYFAGIVINGGTIVSGFPGVDSVISNNVVLNCNLTNSAGFGFGILCDASVTSHPNLTVLRARFINNKVYGSSNYGIAVRIYTIDVTGLTIEGNEVRNSGLSGLYVYYNTGTTKSLINAKIKNNDLISNGQRSVANDTYGMRLTTTTTNCDISDNRCFDDQATKTQTYGIRMVTQLNTGLLLTDNKLIGNGTGAISISGATFDNTTIIDRNLGYNLGGPTAVSVTASPFTYTAGNGFEEVYVDGGTVSAISKSGTTVASSTNRLIRLGPNESMVVTYSVAPTMVSDKR